MFYLVVVTLTVKILSGYIFESIRYIRLIHGRDGDVGKQHHSVTFNLGSAKVCFPAIYGTYMASQAGDYNLHHVHACMRVSRNFLWDYYSYTFLANYLS